MDEPVVETEIELQLFDEDDDENSNEDSNSETNQEAVPLYSQQHRRTTFTHEETRFLHLTSYLRVAYIFWIGYLIPSTIALVVGIIIDFNSKCNAPLLLWASVQLFLQSVAIVVKVFSYYSLPNFSSTPDPEEVHALQHSMRFRAIGWFNKIVYLLWVGWFSTGAIWMVEVLMGIIGCDATVLYVICLSLVVLQLMFLGFLCMFFFCSCLYVIFRIFWIISGNLANGIQVISGASDDLIKEKTSTKFFSDGLMDAADSSCPICLDDYVEDDELRFLPCSGLHHFHAKCVDAWLKSNKSCPLCKRPIDETPEPSETSGLILESPREEDNLNNNAENV